MTCDHRIGVINGHCVICAGAPPSSPEDLISEILALEQSAELELQEVNAELARRSLLEFVTQAWHVLESVEFEMGWHIESICTNLQGIFEEWEKRKLDRSYVMKVQNLLLNICPSTLKSRITMVFFPAWVWIRYPEFMWLCASAAASNVTRDAEDSRELISSSWYCKTFNISWHIREDIDAKQKYANTAGGSRNSRNLMTTIVGLHADGILVDDPDSPATVHGAAIRIQREKYIAGIASRVNDMRHYFFVHAQQRVHEDDSTGALLRQGGWIQASYPLEYHDSTRKDGPFFADPRSVEGEILHPTRFPTDVIAKLRLKFGTHGFNAQYNQQPASLDGGMIGRAGWRFFTVPGIRTAGKRRPEGCFDGPAVTLPLTASGDWDLDWVIISVDATFGSTSKTADGVGLLVIGGKGPKRFIFTDRTAPMSFIDQKNMIRQLKKDYPQADRILIEKAAAGNPIREDLELEFGGIIMLDVKSGKEAKAYAMSPYIEAGDVYLLDGADWVEPFVEELSVFPNGKHDDRVDALSQTMAYFRESTLAQKAQAQIAAIDIGLRAFMR